MLRPWLRERAEEPAEWSRGTDLDCAACGGAMLFKRVPCQDVQEAVTCTQVHFAYECSFCGRVVSEAEVEAAKRRPVGRLLRREEG